MSGARIFVGLGANLGDPVGTFGQAVEKLQDAGCRLSGKSDLYRSKPYGYADQPDFINAAIEISSALDPVRLLVLLQGIEKELGKKISRTNGPRVIDLDLLLYGDVIRDRPAHPPILPHPGVLQRDFVLLPLCDLAPGFRHPVRRKPLEEHIPGLGQTFNTGAMEAWP